MRSSPASPRTMGSYTRAAPSTRSSVANAAAHATGLHALIQRADAVVTGEGRLDASSLTGKVAVSVAQLARKWGKPCVAICGSVERDDTSKLLRQFDAVHSLAELAGSPAAAMEAPSEWITSAAAEAAASLEKLLSA